MQIQILSPIRTFLMVTLAMFCLVAASLAVIAMPATAEANPSPDECAQEQSDDDLRTHWKRCKGEGLTHVKTVTTGTAVECDEDQNDQVVRTHWKRCKGDEVGKTAGDSIDGNELITLTMGS